MRLLDIITRLGNQVIMQTSPQLAVHTERLGATPSPMEGVHKSTVQPLLVWAPLLSRLPLM